MTASSISSERETTIANDVKPCIGNGSCNNDKENTPLSNSKNSIATETIGEKNLDVRKQNAASNNETETVAEILSRPRAVLSKEISKQVLRHKLQKLRHLVIKGAISEDYLDKEIFPKLLDLFDPQTVVYNGGIANVKEWKISCYLEVMEGGVPCTNPHLGLLKVFLPLLETCDDQFMLWYKQQHSCNSSRTTQKKRTCKRLMTFVTRYTPAPGEQALLKHIDGAGKVDGSCVVALPTDDSWYGHGGGLTFWDGKERVEETSSTSSDTKTRRPRFRPREMHYQTRPGDVAFIDRAVWHQADPITKGTRWALVIFYKVTEEETDSDQQ